MRSVWAALGIKRDQTLMWMTVTMSMVIHIWN